MRAARARAAGSNCSQCPYASAYPAQCVAEVPQQWRDDTPDTEGRECPIWLARQFEFYFEAWRWREKGFLPAPGSWTAQPYHVIEALTIIDAAVAQIERERAAAMREEQNKWRSD